jgi:hypothetical protein
MSYSDSCTEPFIFNLLGKNSATVAAWASRFGFQHGVGASGTEVLDVYRTSALRIIPFLGFLIGPLTIVVDILGDIVFFLADGAFNPQRGGPQSGNRTPSDDIEWDATVYHLS